MLNLSEHLQHGARQAGELARALGIERSTLTRAYQRESERVVRLGRARATVYAGRQNRTGLNTDEFRVFRINETGQPSRAGSIVTLVANQIAWLPDATIVDGLPPEFHDMSPTTVSPSSCCNRCM